MTSRRSLVLAVLALVVVALFVLVEMPRQRTQDRERAEASRLFAFDSAQIDALLVRRPGSALHFVLSGTRWEMMSPVRDDAEASAVMAIIATLAQAQVLRDLGAEDPSRYGLSPPVASITLVASGDTVAALELGEYTADRAAVYASRRDGRVLLVPTAIHRASTLSPDDYRNRRVAVFDLSAVRSFVLDSRLTGTSRWFRGAEETWFTVVDGDTVRGDSVAVPSVLRRLRGMRVSAFVPERDAAAPPLVSIAISKTDGSTWSVRFFPGPDGSYWARAEGNPRTVVIADDPSDIAAESVATLRDRRVLHFDPRLASRIVVVTPDTSAVIVRAGERWALPNPALGEVRPERAADFIRALRALRFVRLSGEAAAEEPESPSFSLVVHGADDRILEELSATPRSRDGAVWLARSRSLHSACEVDDSAIDDLRRKLARLRR